MKKKTYIAPEVTLFKVESERICALSDLTESGSDSIQLSKGSGDWDIWGNGSSDDDYDDYDEY